MSTNNSLVLASALSFLSAVMQSPEALKVRGEGRFVLLSKVDKEGRITREIKLADKTGSALTPAKQAQKFLERFADALAQEGILISIHDSDYSLLKHNADYVRMYLGAERKAELIGPASLDAPKIEAAPETPKIEGSKAEDEDESEIDEAMKVAGEKAGK